MPVRSFLDTNLLVYTDDHRDPRKQEAALALLERCRLQSRGVVSTQVLQEYFVTTTRKLGVPAELARRKVEIFARFDLVLISRDDILAAIDLHRLHGISFWDALIVGAALRSGCSVLYSEDLQHSQRISGLEIRDPFR